MARTACIGIAAGLALASGARAQLEGQTVTADWLFPDEGTVIETHDVVVGPAIELRPEDIVNDDKFAIDLTTDTVTFLFNSGTTWSDVPANGWRFRDTNGTIPDITGYSVLSASNGIGNIGRIVTSVTNDSFFANFAGVTVAGPGDFITLKVTFIPAPGAWSALALAGLGVLRRRR